jgi:hypothetical protein
MLAVIRRRIKSHSWLQCRLESAVSGVGQMVSCAVRVSSSEDSLILSALLGFLSAITSLKAESVFKRLSN